VAAWTSLLLAISSPALEAIVEVEEDLYRYEPANNGAGPMWCAGSTCLARVGDVVYATGLETLPGVKPLNNCRWVLWRRDQEGWKRLHVDESGRTREPSPLVVLGEGSVMVSANPTLAPADREGGGPARPEVFWFSGGMGNTSRKSTPVWDGEPRFTEHSYRSFAADAERGECVLFQNIDYTHAEWTFRNADGRWAARGRLIWPWGAGYAKPQPVRVCYPAVALRNRTVHFFGVSDIQEPNPAWRTYKKELTGRDWDYDFRRLFYTSAPDISTGPFGDWIEVSSRDDTGGWLWPCDLWVERSGEVQLLWTERAIDERLRTKFFPGARQSHALKLVRLKDGKIAMRRTLMESNEGENKPTASAARFHATSDGRLFVFLHVGGQSAGNRLVELGVEGPLGEGVAIPFSSAFTSYFTATPRAGTKPSEYLDVLGVQNGRDNTIRYARVRVR